MKPPKRIELQPAEVETLLERVEQKTLQEGDDEIVLHNDDTPMKILELVQEANRKSSRTGMFTTEVVSCLQDYTIVLFFTGAKHTGEYLLDFAPGFDNLKGDHKKRGDHRKGTHPDQRF